MDMSKYIGEATAYDKKLMLERKEPLSWLKSVSAFANTSGGLLLYGVDNDGNLVGLENAERDAEDISEMIKSLMDPIPEFDLSLHVEDGRKFVVVSVKAGTTTPYYVFLKGHRDAYIRIGNESVKANSIDLKRLVLKGIGKILDAYQFESENRGRSIVPQFRSSPSEFHVILPNLNYDAPELHAVCGESAESENVGEEKVRPIKPTLLTEGRNAKIIIRAIRADGYVTIANLCQKTRLSSSGVYKTLAALKAASKIRRVGSARGGYWEVVE